MPQALVPEGLERKQSEAVQLSPPSRARTQAFTVDDGDADDDIDYDDAMSGQSSYIPPGMAYTPFATELVDLAELFEETEHPNDHFDARAYNFWEDPTCVLA